MPSIAEETRRAVDANPFVRQALRAGVLNYTEAARYLDLDDETGAVASALGRYAETLPPLEDPDRTVRVRMDRTVDPSVVTVREDRPERAAMTAIHLEGDVDDVLFARVVSSLSAADLTVHGFGWLDGTGTVLVDGQAGSRALRLVEATVE